MENIGKEINFVLRGNELVFLVQLAEVDFNNLLDDLLSLAPKILDVGKLRLPPQNLLLYHEKADHVLQVALHVFLGLDVFRFCCLDEEPLSVRVKQLKEQLSLIHAIIDILWLL